MAVYRCGELTVLRDRRSRVKH